MNNYSHIVLIDEEKRVLTIERIFPDGKKVLFTSVEIPEISISSNKEIIRRFAMQLGENIISDSPAARRLFGM